jgi:hypothetical protein
MHYTFKYSGIHVTIEDEIGGSLVFQANLVAAEFAKKLVEQANVTDGQADTCPTTGAVKRTTDIESAR